MIVVFMVVVAILTMGMFMTLLGLLFFFLIVRVSLVAIATAHVEVVHVFIIPILTNWLGFIFFILINPFRPIDLDVSILDFIFG